MNNSFKIFCGNSNPVLAQEICDYFETPLIDFKKKVNKVKKDNIKTISIFPISTSLIRSLPPQIVE